MCQTKQKHQQQSEPNWTNQSTFNITLSETWKGENFSENGFLSLSSQLFTSRLFPAALAQQDFSDHGDHHYLLSHHPIHF
jgi:hypothetical protein